jgi:MtrB/PioB family decaheme-associated outer membrane protein
MNGTFSRMTLACVALGLLTSGGAGLCTLAAQTPTAGGFLFTEIEFGARGYVDRPIGTELASFQKYRDDPSGALLENAHLWWRKDAQVVDFRARQAGQRDQRLNLGLTSLGLFDLQLERDQKPHITSSTGRMIGRQEQRGQFTLPVPRPHMLEHDAGSRLTATGVQRDSDRLRLVMTLRPDAPFHAHYMRTTRTGDRPMGMAFGGAGGNFREILEPVEHTKHDLRLSQELATPRYQLSAAYHFSLFDNDLSAVVSDNPLVHEPFAAGAYRGQTALPPSNRAHNLTASGGLNLPYRSRITGGVSYGLRLQDEPLLPHTVNPRLLAEELPVLPDNIAGDVRTLRFDVSARARPLSPLTISARYRFFDLDDRTPGLALDSRVRSDQMILTGPFEARRYPYTRDNAKLDLRWSPVRMVSLGAEYAWERWKRDPRSRNVGETREHVPRVSLDVRPSDRIWLRGSYLRSERRADEYLEGRDLPLLRRFDLADRDRERAGISVQLLPVDALDISLGYDRGESNYPDSPYGRSADREAAWSTVLDWSPSQRITAHLSYVNEEFRVSQRSRHRSTVPLELNNETFDWIGVTDESIRTLGIGGTVSVLPRQLDLGFMWDHSRGSSRVATHNPEKPTSPNTGNRTEAAAEDYPEVRHTLNPGHVRMRYRVSDTWMASVRYTFERFTNDDFRIDGVTPATGMDLFLGNSLPGHTARFLTVTVSHHPWIPGVRRAPY